MPTLVDCPQSNFGEWTFPLFRTLVRVKVWFWAACLITCMGRDSISGILIWVAVCFGSILAHEMGHVAAFRMLGTGADVVLYGWGGLTIPFSRYGVRGTLARVMSSLAGPASGFCVTGLVAAVAWYSGARLQFGWNLLLPSLAAHPATAAGLDPAAPTFVWYVLLNDLLFVNFYWGLVNLLPIHPLDGGQVSRALLGDRKALILSVAAAIGVALAGVLERNGYMVIVFAVLAVSSLQLLEGGHWQKAR